MIKVQLGMSYDSILSVNTAEILHPGTLILKINDQPVGVQWRSTEDGRTIESVFEPTPKAPVYNICLMLKYPGSMPFIVDETVSDGCTISFISKFKNELYVDIREATHLMAQVTAFAVAS